MAQHASLYYKLIGTPDKHDELNSSENILTGFMGQYPVLHKICDAQFERVKNYRSPNIAQSNEKLEQLLKCLEFVLSNKDEILEREMSIGLFGDSKLFEKDFKNKVCSLLESYCSFGSVVFSTDEKGLKKEKILSHFMIVKNPTYFYFKGNGLITFEDGVKIKLSYLRPIVLRSDSTEDIDSIKTS